MAKRYKVTTKSGKGVSFLGRKYVSKYDYFHKWVKLKKWLKEKTKYHDDIDIHNVLEKMKDIESGDKTFTYAQQGQDAYRGARLSMERDSVSIPDSKPINSSLKELEGEK